MAELATYELEGQIATIAMDDGKANVLSIEMLKAVMAALDRAEEDEAVVVLTGREKFFSAGFDLEVFSERPHEIVEMLTLGARLSERLLSFPTPVLVACSGHAIAAGTFPLLAADLRIGIEGPHKLGLNEVRIGLTVPLYVVELARQRLTPRDFNRSLVTAATYDPEQAVDAGFLDRAVPAGELREASLAHESARAQAQLAVRRLELRAAFVDGKQPAAEAELDDLRIAAECAVSMRRDALEFARGTLRLVQAQVDAGMAPQQDLRGAQRSVAEAEAALRLAQLELDLLAGKDQR